MAYINGGEVLFSPEIFVDLSGVDSIRVIERNAEGYPLTIDASRLTLINNEIPAYLFGDGYTTGALAYHCTTMSIPETTKKIGGYAFYRCQEVTTINGLDWNKITDIGSSAFSNTYGLTLVDLSIPLLQTIGVSGFHASNTTRANISGDVTLGSEGHAVTSIATSAFNNQVNIETITVYTENGVAGDLTGAPWGAVNATITYIAAT